MKLKKRTVVLILIAVPLLGVVGWLFWLVQGGRWAVAAAKERARVAGMAMTMEEFLPPHVPDADNAAPIMAKLGPLIRVLQLRSCRELAGPPHLLGAIVDDQIARRDIRYFPSGHHSIYEDPKGDAAWLAANRKTTETRRAWLTAQLDSASALAALAVIREAVAKPGYDPRVRYRRGSMPRWSGDGDQIANGAILLSGYALLAADRGQTEEGCEDVWAMLRLADFLATEPILSRQYNRLNIWRMAIENVEELSASGKLSPAWNQKFAGRLATMNPAGDLSRDVFASGILGGELYFEGILNGKITFNSISPSTSWGFPNNFGDQVWYGFHGVVRREYASYIDWYRQVSAAIAEPGISLMVLDQRLKDIDVGITPDRKILSKLLPDTLDLVKNVGGPRSGPLAVAWGPSAEWSASGIGGMIRTVWPLRTKIAVAQVGLALERYRAEKGEYPKALAALVPEFLTTVPTDVVAGNPVQYFRLTGGVMVFGFDIFMNPTSGSLHLVDYASMGKGGKTVWLAGKPIE